MNEYAVTQTHITTVVLRADDPDDALGRYDLLMAEPSFEPTETTHGRPDVWEIMAGVDYPSDVMPEDEDVLPPHGW